jgi:hypothetical protein
LVTFVPFYAYIIRTVVTRYVSYQFTHIYNLNARLPLFHSMLKLSEQACELFKNVNLGDNGYKQCLR